MIAGSIQDQGLVVANGSKLENVDSFTYFESCLDRSGDAMTDVNIRIGKGVGVLKKLHNILKDPGNELLHSGPITEDTFHRFLIPVKMRTQW